MRTAYLAIVPQPMRPLLLFGTVLLLGQAVADRHFAFAALLVLLASQFGQGDRRLPPSDPATAGTGRKLLAALVIGVLWRAMPPRT